MKIPELFHHLEYFSSEDYTQFEKFLKSPYYNSIKAYGNIFTIIKDHKKYVEEKKYSELKSAIVKETGYSEKTVSKSLSHLSDLCVEFTKAEAFRNEKLKGNIIHGTYLLLKGNMGLLNKRVGILEDMLKDQNHYNQEVFLDLYDFNKLKYNVFHFSEESFDPISKLENKKRYTIESSSNLIVFTLASLTINLINYVLQCDGDDKEQSKYTFNLEKMYGIMQTPEYKSYNSFQKTTITLFYKIYKLFSDIRNDGLYIDYKKYFNKVKGMYSDEFKITNINLQMTYSAMRSRVLDKEKLFFNESFNLLYEYLDGNYYKTDKVEFLHPTLYRNYVINCVHRKEKEMLKRLIDKQTDKLNPSDRINMKNFAMGFYCLLNKQFDHALRHINRLDIQRFFYKIDIQTLKIKLFYEKNDLVEMKNIIHNFKEYLLENKSAVKHEEAKYFAMLKNLELLILERNKYEKRSNISGIEFLRKKIEREPGFNIRSWVMEKIDEFIKDHYKRNKT
ncbi:MAG: hypothetical protein NTY74_00535 [Ignavibacteriae bacterium]|nr:hypothetical protein [Ignavibacteriota bacterium]